MSRTAIVLNDDFSRDNDVASVVAVLRSRGLHSDGAAIEAARLTGGRSNLTYRVTTSEGEFVLRRPPASNRLPTAHNMRREYDILCALADTGVPVPEPVLFCSDTAVNHGIPFYVMDYVEGFVADGESVERIPVATRDSVARSLAAVLAQIHGIEVQDRPLLKALDRGDGYLARQVERWRRQWQAALTRREPNGDWVAAWLTANTPADSAATLVHGDFRLDNCILAPRRPSDVRAVVDWEMGTVGEPLLDLATFLVYWVRPDDPPELATMFPTANMSLAEGFPSRAEMVAEYERSSGREWTARAFYTVLAFFKLAAICEGIHRRYVSGGTRGAGFEGYDERATILLRYARAVACDEYRFL